MKYHIYSALQCALVAFLCDIEAADKLADGIQGETSIPFEAPAADVNTSALMFYIINSALEPRLELYTDSEVTAAFNYSVVCEKATNFTISLKAPDPNVIRIRGSSLISVSCDNAVSSGNLTQSVSSSRSQSFSVHGNFPVTFLSGIIGRSDVEFELLGDNDEFLDTHSKMTPMYDDVPYDVVYTPKTLTFTVTVIRKIRPVDTIFRVVIYCVQIFVMIGFGANLDLAVVKENLYRPIAPGIGLFCQYIMMPLIAFTVAKAVKIDNTAVSLGIFIAGCCPGGGGSNMYSYLLKGDLSLSITMTALSTVGALGMMPFWVYTLGRLFEVGKGVTIPFEMVVVSLSILIVPLLLGILLRQKRPKAADRLQKILKPVVIFMTCVLLVVGIYSNLYIFRLFKPRIILAACLLPYVGYLVGGVIAAILRQDWKRIKTISIETGMQNTSIAYILLTTSFPAPDGDLAAVGPVASAVMTPLPPFLVTIVYLIYQKCKKKYEPVEKENFDENPPKTNGDTNKNTDEASEKLTEV